MSRYRDAARSAGRPQLLAALVLALLLAGAVTAILRAGDDGGSRGAGAGRPRRTALPGVVVPAAWQDTSNVNYLVARGCGFGPASRAKLRLLLADQVPGGGRVFEVQLPDRTVGRLLPDRTVECDVRAPTPGATATP